MSLKVDIRKDLDGFFDSEAKINLKPQQCHVGLLFQNYALFPNMTVWQILMLDEPFSALDSYLRWNLEMELSELLKEFQGSILFVMQQFFPGICGRRTEDSCGRLGRGTGVFGRSACGLSVYRNTKPSDLSGNVSPCTGTEEYDPV